ncbi:MAG: hypothetical protein N4A39_17380 [Roseicyclus sp.]|jgi:hypothetical protein|nr:hypothetical protein [Roseicyclus sp.]
MKRFLTAALALALLPTTAFATGGQEVTVQARDSDRRIACYREVEMPAQYRVEQVLVTPPVQYYFRRNTGIVELRETPAVYEERRTLVQEARIVMQEVACPSR